MSPKKNPDHQWIKIKKFKFRNCVRYLEPCVDIVHIKPLWTFCVTGHGQIQKRVKWYTRPCGNQWQITRYNLSDLFNKTEKQVLIHIITNKYSLVILEGNVGVGLRCHLCQVSCTVLGCHPQVYGQGGPLWPLSMRR